MTSAYHVLYDLGRNNKSVKSTHIDSVLGVSHIGLKGTEICSKSNKPIGHS